VLGTMTLSYEGEVYGSLDLAAVDSVELSEFLYRKAQVEEFLAQSGTKLILGAVLAVVLIIAIWLFAFRKRRRRPASAAHRGRYSGRRRR